MTSLKKLKHHLTAAKEYFDEHCNFDCVCRAEYSTACNPGGAVCGYIADALEMIEDELKEDKEEMTNKDSLKADKKELKKLNKLFAALLRVTNTCHENTSFLGCSSNCPFYELCKARPGGFTNPPLYTTFDTMANHLIPEIAKARGKVEDGKQRKLQEAD